MNHLKVYIGMCVPYGSSLVALTAASIGYHKTTFITITLSCKTFAVFVSIINLLTILNYHNLDIESNCSKILKVIVIY